MIKTISVGVACGSLALTLGASWTHFYAKQQINTAHIRMLTEDKRDLTNVLRRDNGIVSGIKRINHDTLYNTDGEGDINLFGNGTQSHAGMGLNKLRVWSRNGNDKVLDIGWTSSTEVGIGVKDGEQLNIGGTWQNPIKIANTYMWIKESNAKMYVKQTLPTSDTDGTVVGTQL